MNVKKIGRYEILKTLGRGAMGVVYLARDPIIDRQVALKTLRLDLDTDVAAEFRERFFREARAAGRLNHPGIVTIHDVGEDQASGVVFIAMEYIRGLDLKMVFSAGHRFKPYETARIVAELAQALAYAHSMGVVHRDVKPANIILTENGSVKIMDFGVARLDASNLTVEGQFIGTPNFMSPEQILGKKVDGRSDLFSLGVVLFYLLTGKRPFAGETIHGVTMKIVQEACPIPSTLIQGLAPGFNPVVLRCLEKEPDRRFQSGTDMATVLEALARSLAKLDGVGTGKELPPIRVPAELMQARVEEMESGGPDLIEAAEIEEIPAFTQAADGAAPPPLPVDEADASTASSTPDRTKISSPRTAPIKVRTKPAWLDLPKLLRRFPLPEFFFFEVQTSWVLRILIPWAVLWLGVISILAMLREEGPFPAPSAASIRSLHRTAVDLREAKRHLAADDLNAAEIAIMRAIDQVPASPAARRIAAEVRQRISTIRDSEDTRRMVAEIISDGRTLYRSRQYAEAAARFEEVLGLHPDNETAQDYLDMIQERLERSDRPQQQAPARPSWRPITLPRREAAPRPTATPGLARITVYFDSPITDGTIELIRNNQPLREIAFSFKKSRLAFLSRKTPGQVKQTIAVPSGRQTIHIRLNDTEKGPLGEESFTEDLRDGSYWTLRIDLPPKSTEPRFYLVRARQ